MKYLYFDRFQILNTDGFLYDYRQIEPYQGGPEYQQRRAEMQQQFQAELSGLRGQSDVSSYNPPTDFNTPEPEFDLLRPSNDSYQADSSFESFETLPSFDSSFDQERDPGLAESRTDQPIFKGFDKTFCSDRSTNFELELEGVGDLKLSDIADSTSPFYLFSNGTSHKVQWGKCTSGEYDYVFGNGERALIYDGDIIIDSAYYDSNGSQLLSGKNSMKRPAMQSFQPSTPPPISSMPPMSIHQRITPPLPPRQQMSPPVSQIPFDQRSGFSTHNQPDPFVPIGQPSDPADPFMNPGFKFGPVQPPLQNSRAQPQKMERVQKYGSVKEISSMAEFDREVLHHKGPVLVDYYTTYCGPCIAFLPKLKQFAKQYDNVKVLKVDIQTCPDLASKYDISIVPVFQFFKDGKMKHQHAKVPTLQFLEDTCKNKIL